MTANRPHHISVDPPALASSHESARWQADLINATIGMEPTHEVFMVAQVRTLKTNLLQEQTCNRCAETLDLRILQHDLLTADNLIRTSMDALKPN